LARAGVGTQARTCSNLYITRETAHWSRDALEDAGLLVFARQLGVCGVLPADLALQFVAGGLFQAGGLIEL
jgi:hypothetical protein